MLFKYTVFMKGYVYPCYFDKKKEPNPYSNAIGEVGVGSFAFLPSAGGQQGSLWLK